MSESEKRSRGYMTNEEFVKMITPGLIDYLNDTFSRDVVHHPEDLATHASIYFDVSFRVISSLTTQWQNQLEN